MLFMNTKIIGIRLIYREVMSDQTYLKNVLNEGKKKAEITAKRTLNECYDAFGFIKV